MDTHIDPCVNTNNSLCANVNSNLCEVELVISDLPFSYAYTIGCADKIGVEFVLAGSFEPIEYHNYLHVMVPILLKRWHAHKMNEKLNDRIAAAGVLQHPVELQRCHTSYIAADMFPHLPKHVPVVQIVIFDENGRLPGDPGHVEDSQPDLFLDHLVDDTQPRDTDTHDTHEHAPNCIEITGFDT